MLTRTAIMATRDRLKESLACVRGAGSLTARVLTTLALTTALALPAQPAFAWRSASDRVGGSPISAGDVKASQAPDIDAAAGILVTPQGRALWSRNGTDKRAMASTTKMMTALLVLEKGNLNKKIRISKKAARVPYALGLRKGEKIRARRVLELTLIASSNDGAYALGEYRAGNMKRFVKLMNAKAREIGMDDTHFANAHGLDARGHYSTPADMALLAQTVMKNPEFRRIVKKRSVVMPKAKGRRARRIKSTASPILGHYPGLKGGKTGFTNDAGYNYVSTATRNGVTLTAVIMGAGSHRSRFTQTRRLFDWGFKNLAIKTVATPGAMAAKVAAGKNSSRTVEVAYSRRVKVPVFRLDGRVKTVPALTEQTGLPVLKGQPLGEIRIVQRSRTLARITGLAATTTASTTETVGTVPVTDYDDRVIAARIGSLPAPSPKFDARIPVDVRTKLADKVAAPVTAGDRLGEITYSQAGRVVATIPLVASESVEVPTFMDNLSMAFERGWRAVTGGPSAQPRVIRT